MGDPLWIEHMHMKKGALTKKATRAGQSPMEFASEHQADDSKTGKQARLAMTLQNFHSNLPSGVALSPKGDIGAHRGLEAKTAAPFKGTKIMKTAEYFHGG
jgi:hypothetical protein